MGPLDRELARELDGELARDPAGSLPPAGSADDDGVDGSDGCARHRVADLVAALVRRRGEQHPWALLLDDVHLADPATLDVLTLLAHEAPVPGVLVVLTLRPVPYRPAVQDLVTAWVRAGARDVELAPLSAVAVQLLAERTLGALPGPLLRGVLATAGGNPWLVHQVLGAARQTASLAPLDEVPDSFGPSAVSPSPAGSPADAGPSGPAVVDLHGSAWQAELDRRVRRHVAYLEPPVLTLLAQASVLGTSFVVPDLAALAALDVTTCWRTLRHALAAGLVAARGDRLVFRHDLVRTALYDGLPPGQRQALHARAAWALEQAGAPAHMVSTHLERARSVAGS